MDCRSAMQQLFDYLDEELTDERMAAVAEHLRDCRACHPHYDFEKLVLDTLHSLREEHAAPSELRARVVDALQREGMRAGMRAG